MGPSLPMYFLSPLTSPLGSRLAWGRLSLCWLLSTESHALGASSRETYSPQGTGTRGKGLHRVCDNH